MKITHPEDRRNLLDKIEVLSFEHLIERSPTRTSKEITVSHRDRVEKLWQRRQYEGGAENSAVLLRPTEKRLTKLLADTLEQAPVTVLKFVDKSSKSIYELAKKITLVESVTLSAWTHVQVKDEFLATDLLKVELKDAFIIDFQVVGAYALQPWLGMNPDLWASGDHHDIGPMEKVVLGYNTIKWTVNGKETLQWHNNTEEASRE